MEAAWLASIIPRAPGQIKIHYSCNLRRVAARHRAGRGSCHVLYALQAPSSHCSTLVHGCTMNMDHYLFFQPPSAPPNYYRSLMPQSSCTKLLADGQIICTGCPTYLVVYSRAYCFKKKYTQGHVLVARGNLPRQKSPATLAAAWLPCKF